MSIYHPAVYAVLCEALAHHQRSQALAMAVADMYDTRPQVQYHDAAIAGLTELLAVLAAGEADEAEGERLIAEDDARTEALADARRLLDLIEAEGLPFEGMRACAYPDGSPEEQCAKVDRAAAILGVDVRDRMQAAGHYVAETDLGRSSYAVVYIPAAASERYEAVQRLGNEALERLPRHAMTAAGELTPRCGEFGDVAVMASDVTCESCVALMVEQDTDGYTAEQLDGTACMVCGRTFDDGHFRDEIGTRGGRPVFAHYDCDVPYTDPTAVVELLERDDPQDDDLLASMLGLETETHWLAPGTGTPACGGAGDTFSNMPTCSACCGLLDAHRGTITPPTGELS